MALRTGLVASATIAKADDTAPFTISAHNLGDATTIEPTDQGKAVLAGYTRPAGAPFNVAVEAFEDSNFDTLNAWQKAGELLNVTLTFDDGSTKKALSVGFTVQEQLPSQVGDFDGWLLSGVAQGGSVADALTIAPAYSTP